MKKIVVIGSINLDVVAKVHHIPMVGETVMAEDGGQFQGGKGANQACAIAKLGGDVIMLGAVGKDDAGEYLLKGLKDNGVDTEHVLRLSGVPTGQARITVNREGNNSIVVVPGANASVSVEHIHAMRAVIENADIVVMQLEIPLETVCHAARLAKSLNKLVILDPAPAVENFPDSLLACADFLKPNETELAILTGCEPAQYQDGARRLIERGVKNVIVSLGEQGVYCRSGEETIQKAARKVKAVDTTAAGDGFIAAFALGLATGKAMEEAIDFAQRVASIVVTRPGAQESIPTAAELAAEEPDRIH